ncbi:MAG: amidohydrolase [Ruminococcaceae bacterium]|nr:amidohydrolase [Oscillospiraceae bacterium]
MDILNEAKSLESELIEMRRYLHTHAGVGFDTEDAVNFVMNALESTGLNPKKCGRGGVTCEIGKNGRCVLIRADMDALNIREESGEEFASENGNMHACGHDMHTAMLLGAAKILKEHENELHGRVRLMFQSAEETLEGANDMIESDVLESPRPDAAMMIHVMVGTPFETGTVIVAPPGVSAPCADMFKITVLGRAAHGSMPEAGIDPIIVSAHIISALDIIRTREVSSGERAVLTVGSINAGKTANAIPSSCVILGNMRVYSDKSREYMKKRVVEIAAGVASSLGASAKVEFTGGCPTLTNDRELCKKAYEYTQALLGKKLAMSAENMKSSSSGSEDFAYISHEIPSVMLALAAGNSNEGYSHPLHHEKVRFDEKALTIGAAVYAYMAIKLLE